MAVIRKKTWGDRVFNIITYTVFTLLTLACVLPFYYIIINTISDNQLVATGQILIYPKGLHFENYLNALKLDRLPRAFLISLSRVVLGTGFVVICASFPGYAFTRREFWHRKFFYRFMISAMYINAGVIPVFLAYKTLGLYNNYWVYILPGIVSPFNMILCKTYIESIPAALEESAQIDGAGYFVRYTRIVLPLAVPILATINIFTAVGHWNSFMDTVLYIINERYYTLQYVLYQYLNEADAVQEIVRNNPDALSGRDLSTLLTPLTVRYTVSVITIVPILLVYPFFQRYFVKGIMIGAVKG